MKKLIKPVMSMEDYTEEVVQAFCDLDGCSSNCGGYYLEADGKGGFRTGCGSVNKVEVDEDILF